MNINPTGNLTNPQLVTVAVFLLGGDSNQVDREDIAIKVNEIAPGRFNWRKYPERIDLTAVTDALRDAKKAKHNALLVGNNRAGWMLSAAGLRWLNDYNIDDLGNVESSKSRMHSISAHQQAECARMRTTRAFMLFREGKLDHLDVQDFYAFARVNSYFQTKARQKRYTVIDNAVISDDELSQLWRYLKDQFAEEMV